MPSNWKPVSYLCLKPLGSYFNDLIARIEFISSWCYEGAPKSFWLPGLFFPQGFITGVFQTYSRKHLIPIDTIKFLFHPLLDPVDSISKAPGERCDCPRVLPRRRRV